MSPCSHLNYRASNRRGGRGDGDDGDGDGGESEDVEW